MIKESSQLEEDDVCIVQLSSFLGSTTSIMIVIGHKTFDFFSSVSHDFKTPIPPAVSIYCKKNPIKKFVFINKLT